MEYKTCEEYILNKYVELQEKVDILNNELAKAKADYKNADNIIELLRSIVKLEYDDNDFNLVLNESVRTNSQDGDFYRRVLFGLFGPKEDKAASVEDVTIE